VKRASYTEPITVEQVLYGEGDEVESVGLPADVLNGWNGLADFFTLTVSKNGETVVDKTMSFCPGGYLRERVSDNGPAKTTYPETCFGNPFTKGIVWGIDTDWAVSTYNYYETGLDIGRGRYTLEMAIAPEYVDMFDVDPAKASATVSLRVKRYEDGCYEKCHAGRGATARPDRAGVVPVIETPDPATLPDLISLPAWGINVNNGKKRSWLTFGATVWNGGSSDLVVEGFRRSDENLMDGWQYFYDGDEPVGKAQVGNLAFDDREGHEHWHFLQFAEYTLLDSTQLEIVKSKKEAFCLAPTDAIDMLVPNARWNPGEIGIGTACGTPNSIWVREILANGWGDTYFQGIPGQSFNITNLSNGTYYIGVRANPLALLHEQTDANNFEVREITLSGKAGNRKVAVPPWNGIDTEGQLGEGIGGGGFGG
jgi:hypothetical protein